MRVEGVYVPEAEGAFWNLFSSLEAPSFWPLQNELLMELRPLGEQLSPHHGRSSKPSLLRQATQMTCVLFRGLGKET